MEDGDSVEAGCGARTHHRRAALPREYCRTQINSGVDPDFVELLDPDLYFFKSLKPDPKAIIITFKGRLMFLEAFYNPLLLLNISNVMVTITKSIF